MFLQPWFWQHRLQTLNNVVSTTVFLELDGPESILPDQCYPFAVNRKFADGSINSVLTTGVSFAPSAGLSFYSDATCTTTATSANTVIHTPGVVPVYAKLTNAIGQNTVTLSGSSITSTTQKVFQGLGTNTPVSLQIRGDNMGPQRDICYSQHAYRVSVVNQQNTAVLPTANLTVDFGNLSNVNYYAASTCGTSQTQTTIPANTNSVSFYIKPSGTTSVSLQASAVGLSAGIYSINSKGHFENTSVNVPGGLNLADNAACVGASGNFYCWGKNVLGRLGVGNNTDQLISGFVQAVGGNWSKVALAPNFGCGLDSFSNIHCWGDNTFGQLGDNTTNSSIIPTTASQLSGAMMFSKFAIGDNFGCAINSTDHKIYCWGNNSDGQFGNNSTSPSLVPIVGPSALTFSDLSIHGHTVCAILDTDSTLRCWGKNDSGQFGNGTLTNSLTPVVVDASVPYAAVSVGTTHTCGIRSSNNYIYCWGNNAQGQLGTGDQVNQGYPTYVASDGFSKISSGNLSTCALTLAGIIYCWGDNTYGQLGLNDNTKRLSPIAVSFPGSASSVSIGDQVACATLSASGQLYCWGSGANGGLGNNSTAGASVPQPVTY